jgi:hypothetical protein
MNVLLELHDEVRAPLHKKRGSYSGIHWLAHWEVAAEMLPMAITIHDFQSALDSTEHDLKNEADEAQFSLREGLLATYL